MQRFASGRPTFVKRNGHGTIVLIIGPPSNLKRNVTEMSHKEKYGLELRIIIVLST